MAGGSQGGLQGKRGGEGEERGGKAYDNGDGNCLADECQGCRAAGGEERGERRGGPKYMDSYDMDLQYMLSKYMDS